MLSERPKKIVFYAAEVGFYGMVSHPNICGGFSTLRRGGTAVNSTFISHTTSPKSQTAKKKNNHKYRVLFFFLLQKNIREACEVEKPHVQFQTSKHIHTCFCCSSYEKHTAN